MHRFFVPPQLITPTRASLPPEAARQAASVLRLRPGERIILLDNLGWEYILLLEQVSSSAVSGRVLEKQPAGGEPAVPVWLYQALTNREKFEWILQKSAELGAAGVTPILTERSLVRQAVEEKHERWQRILQEAAEQSARGRIPVLKPAMPLKEALAEACPAGLGLFAWEEEKAAGLGQAVQQAGKPGQISLFIGPEGGFSLAEADLARQAGAQVVTLGRRILRTETAALASLAVVMHALGELG